MSGDIVEALPKGGLMRLRAVSIGTFAFQTYAGSARYLVARPTRRPDGR
jgi:hypothetical protein